MAIELEHALNRMLCRAVDSLVGFRKDVRWVKESQMHLTVKFLGEVPDAGVPDVCDAADRFAAASRPFSLTLDRCGCFPPVGKVRVVWGGAAATPPELLACAARCEDEYARLGFAREQRPFAAHVTVGRVRDDRTAGRLRDAVGALKVRPASQQVGSITVFQSVLGPQGAEHIALGRFPFSGGS